MASFQSKKRWRIVGFKHPEKEKSLIYAQNLNDYALVEWLRKGIKDGCNLFSIRGFEVENGSS